MQCADFASLKSFYRIFSIHLNNYYYFTYKFVLLENIFCHEHVEALYKHLVQCDGQSCTH